MQQQQQRKMLGEEEEEEEEEEELVSQVDDDILLPVPGLLSRDSKPKHTKSKEDEPSSPTIVLASNRQQQQQEQASSFSSDDECTVPYDWQDPSSNAAAATASAATNESFLQLRSPALPPTATVLAPRTPLPFSSSSCSTLRPSAPYHNNHNQNAAPPSPSSLSPSFLPQPLSPLLSSSPFSSPLRPSSPSSSSSASEMERTRAGKRVPSSPASRKKKKQKSLSPPSSPAFCLFPSASSSSSSSRSSSVAQAVIHSPSKVLLSSPLDDSFSSHSPPSSPSGNNEDAEDVDNEGADIPSSASCCRSPETRPAVEEKRYRLKRAQSSPITPLRKCDKPPLARKLTFTSFSAFSSSPSSSSSEKDIRDFWDRKRKRRNIIFLENTQLDDEEEEGENEEDDRKQPVTLLKEVKEENCNHKEKKSEVVSPFLLRRVNSATLPRVPLSWQLEQTKNLSLSSPSYSSPSSSSSSSPLLVRAASSSSMVVPLPTKLKMRNNCTNNSKKRVQPPPSSPALMLKKNKKKEETLRGQHEGKIKAEEGEEEEGVSSEASLSSHRERFAKNLQQQNFHATLLGFSSSSSTLSSSTSLSVSQDSKDPLSTSNSSKKDKSDNKRKDKEIDNSNNNRPTNDDLFLINDLYTSMQINADLDKETEQPPHLLVPLLQYQKQGLAWMLDRETEVANPRGGILADAMGLGKTIQMLSLITMNRATTEAATNNRCGRSTLIVCPLSMLDQWLEETRNRVQRKAGLTALVYYGSNRTKDIHWLSKFEIVLTTYGTLAAEYMHEKSKRKNDSTLRRQTNNNNSPLHSIRWYRVVLDEAQMIKNSSTRAALAAYNLNATNRWCLTGTPIQNSLDDIYSLLHFIRAENMNDRWWWNLMIVKPIRRNNSRGLSRLQNMLQGVVLRRTKQHTIDGKPILSLPPCHIVKIETPFSPTESQFYNALFENAQSIFNAYLESGNLLKHYIHILELLLRLRQCCVHPLLVLMCTTLDWRKQKGRKQTSSLHDLKREYERTLQQLLAKNNEEDINDNKTEKKRRKPADLAACLLSSTPKRSPLERHKASLLLIRNSDKENVLDEEEEEEEEEATMGEAGNGGVDLCYICYSNFEEDVMETSCGHRFCKECIENWLIEGRGKEGAGGEEMEGEGRCPILSCGRKLTLKTLKNVSQQQQQIEEERRRNNRIEEAERGATPTTPLKALLLKRNSSFWNANEEERKQIRQEEGEGESEEEFHFLRSTKIAALIKELHRHCSSRREMEDIDRKDSSVSASSSSSPPEKCLVFSQFTMCLDLIELALQQEGFHYVRLDGSLSKSQRAAAINRFKRNPSTTVFLISLKTGGCGLNLTEATRVYLMDPWWNPSAEQQAIDRAFRLGQQRPVTVTRFIIKGSIEERILEIQEEKRRMAHDAFSGTSSLSTAGNTAADDGGVSPSAARVECSHHEGTTLGVKDLRSLFQK